MSNTRTTFNPHYLAYVAEFGTTNLHAFNDAGTEALRAALQLEPGQRILDLGCGTGRTVLTFTTKSRVDMIGMDWLEEMLHVARVRLNLARLAPRLVRGDAAAGLPFQAGCYDAVFTESVLSIHSADRVYAIGNAGTTRDCSRNIEQTTTIWSPVCSSQESRHDTHFTGATIPPSPL